jgi:sodium/potassium-transporting ATPase subunit alpha
MFAMLLWAGSALCFIAFGLAPDDPSNVNLKIYFSYILA